jgi:hypothetical protein
MFTKNLIFSEVKNYLQNFIYSVLFLLIGMPDIGNIGVEMLHSGKG